VTAQTILGIDIGLVGGIATMTSEGELLAAGRSAGPLGAALALVVGTSP
jgi:hypothetical protein